MGMPRTDENTWSKTQPEKCVFGVEEGKFLGYLVIQREIEANPDKIQAIQQMREPQTIREVQLTGRMVALNRFISRAGDKGLPFFITLRNIKNFQWTKECHQAFQELESYLARPPLLSKPEPGEPLLLYLATSAAAASAVLTKYHEGVHQPALFPSAPCHCPNRQTLGKPPAKGTSSRIIKWSYELNEFELEYQPRTAIKAQVLADFLMEYDPEEEKGNDGPREWTMFVDGSATTSQAGGGSLKGARRGRNALCY
ncbi:UNVERIFIED_CONTAM: hypothetical protein Sradi_1691400 [Sesamum radiatum]|uniref:Reverse transcriptase/retrotransposon-derived protein RNase H-like domain-containing protein n=1 Tax=Sesamum radiatum TaxID=300843 RepID=A0AAW2UDC0_SESRA